MSHSSCEEKEDTTLLAMGGYACVRACMWCIYVCNWDITCHNYLMLPMMHL